jgi:hypothetical protein
MSSSNYLSNIVLINRELLDQGNQIDNISVNTISNTAVTPDTYLNASFTVNSEGRLINAQNGNINNVTPTTTIGDLLVHSIFGSVIRLPVGTANNGDVLTVNRLGTTNTYLEWAPPVGGASLVVETPATADADNFVINVSLASHAHNTTFIINHKDFDNTVYTYNLPPISLAEQGVSYRFSAISTSAVVDHTWTIVPDGTDVIQFAGHIDTGTPKVKTFEANAGNPAFFETTSNDIPNPILGAGITLMAFKPASGVGVWVGVGLAMAVSGPAVFI